MHIKKIIRQHRRDFEAEFVCEHCGHMITAPGYDDKYFHQDVIPDWKCPECGRRAGETYRPLATKYKEGELV